MNQKNSSTSRDRKVFDLDLPINDTYTTRNRAEFLFLFNSYYVIAVMWLLFRSKRNKRKKEKLMTPLINPIYGSLMVKAHRES